MEPLLAAFCAIAGIGGIFLAASGFQPAPEGAQARPVGAIAERVQRIRAGMTRTTATRIVIGLAAGVILFATSGWVIALVAAPAAAIFLPVLLGSTKAKAGIERLEALQVWTRGFGGLIEGAGSVEQALRASRHNTPALLSGEVDRMIARLDSGWRTADALQAFADELDDSTADIVLGHIKINVEQRGAGLGRVLQEVSDTIREEIKTRRQIEADRASVRTSQRIITLMLLGLVVGIALIVPFIGGAFSFYQSPVGQVIITVLLAGYGATLWWQHRSTAPRRLARLLVDEGATS